VETLASYSIPFVGLKKGVHFYEYRIDDSFFELMGNDLISKGLLEVELELNKKETMMELDFHFGGTVRLICDRCTGEYDQPVADHGHLIVKFGHETMEENEEILILASNEIEINVAQYIYEFIILALPMRHVHPTDEDGNSTCDPEFLERLESLERHEESEEKPDPRWDALRRISGLNDN
jgi:uncharacterized metal-binding protein YceD (DUF177 family)